jgi:cytochrome c oxidase subunit 3
MIERRVLDVSGLPEIAFGHRDPLWWGCAGLIAIESTMLVLLLATYFYLRGNFTAWPPTGVGGRVQAYAGAEAAVLALSALPTHLSNRAALRGDVRGIQRWIGLLTVMGAVFLLLRWRVLAIIPFRWDLHAYGSVFWGFLFLNTLHALSGVLENATILLLALRGPIEKKHLVDVHTGGFLWYFVVASWLPCWFVLYIVPGLLRSQWP